MTAEYPFLQLHLNDGDKVIAFRSVVLVCFFPLDPFLLPLAHIHEAGVYVASVFMSPERTMLVVRTSRDHESWFETFDATGDWNLKSTIHVCSAQTLRVTFADKHTLRIKSGAVDATFDIRDEKSCTLCLEAD